MDYKRARTEEKAKHRKKQILDASKKLLEEGSIDDVNFTNLSKLTKLTRPAMYKYFKQKEEILLIILEEEVCIMVEELIKIVPKYNEETLKEFSEELANVYYSHENLVKIMPNLMTTIEKKCSIIDIAKFRKTMLFLLKKLAKEILMIFPEISKKDLYIMLYTMGNMSSVIYPTINVESHSKEFKDEEEEIRQLIEFDHRQRFANLIYQSFFELLAHSDKKNKNSKLL